MHEKGKYMAQRAHVFKFLCNKEDTVTDKEEAPQINQF